MLISELQTYFNFDEQTAKGHYKGYDVFPAQFQQDFMSYPVLIFRFNTNITPEILKMIRKEHKKLGNIILDKCGYVLNIACLSLNGKYKEEKVNSFFCELDRFIEFLQDNQIETLHSCVICREEKDETLEEHLQDGRYVLTHASCFESFKNYKMSKIMENEANTDRYPMSILFTILGAIIGYLPFFFVLFLTGYLVGLGFFLIPLAAFFGYKLGKAPLNKKSTIIISVVSSIVMVLGVLLLVKLVQLSSETAITYSQAFNACLGDIFFCVVMGALGIYSSIRYISKDNNEKKLRDMQ